MMRLMRSDTGRLWIVTLVLISLTCLPAIALAGPKGGGSGESGDPDDWGIDFSPGQVLPDSGGTHWDQIGHSTPRDESPMSRWIEYWIVVLARIRYLSH